MLMHRYFALKISKINKDADYFEYFISELTHKLVLLVHRRKFQVVFYVNITRYKMALLILSMSI